MKKTLTCIECPRGCSLSVDIENCKAVSVSGNKCPRGLEYAKAEIENPSRVLTAVVRGRGLEVKMVPVRSNAPIPKTRIMEAMAVVRKTTLTSGVRAGDAVIRDILGLGIDMIATRDVAEASGHNDG